MTALSCRSLVVAFVLCVIGVAAGCPSPVNPGGEGCGVDQPCAAGLACQEGACIARCDQGGSCDNGVTAELQTGAPRRRR